MTHNISSLFSELVVMLNIYSCLCSQKKTTVFGSSACPCYMTSERGFVKVLNDKLGEYAKFYSLICLAVLVFKANRSQIFSAPFAFAPLDDKWFIFLICGLFQRLQFFIHLSLRTGSSCGLQLQPQFVTLYKSWLFNQIEAAVLQFASLWMLSVALLEGMLAAVVSLLSSIVVALASLQQQCTVS